MKKVVAGVLLLALVVLCSVSIYGAYCKQANGTEICGESCQTSGSTCQCEGECSEAELEAVAN